MMKLLLPLLSFFMGSAKNLFKEPGVAITQQVVMHVRSLTLIVVTCLGALTLFCVSLSLLVAGLARQVEVEDGFVFSNGMIVYSVMVVLSLAVLIYGLKKDTWLRSLGFETRPQQQAASSKGGALENAVALLVMDYVEERQAKRQKTEQESQSA
ncbi:hypothetical protein D3C87_1436330 [compost metagenome]